MPATLVRRWSPAKTTLLAASALHVVNDAFIATIKPLLPFITADLGLSIGQAGLLVGVLSGAAAILQIPAGIWVERLTPTAELGLLVGGNAWMAGGLMAMMLAPTYLLLLAAAVVGGLGGNAQHPVATGLVSRAFERDGRGSAVGAINFAGDIGKFLAPALIWLIGLVYVAISWRAVLGVLAGAGLLCSVVTLAARRAVEQAVPAVPAPPADRLRHQTDGAATSRWGIAAPRPFALLVVVGIVDATGRGAGLVLLSFVLAAQGLDVRATSGIFALIFLGGAAGKLTCGWLSDRMSSVRVIWATEIVSVLTLLLFLILEGPLLLPLALLCGFALNGTSSVLYAGTATLVQADRRARGYGLYYTAVEGAYTIGPPLFGLAAGALGLTPAVVLLAITVLTTLPLSLPLRRVLR